MCGLAGVVGNLFKPEVDAFRDLLLMASMRGIHSSGLGAVSGAPKDRKFAVVKTLGGPCNLLETRGWDREVNSSKVALIGHCRHATLGEITHENAHPFDYETVLGTHNGTLRGDWRKELGNDTSDSRALYRNLDHATPADVMKDVEGAWALAWYDRELETFNLLRNAERTLFYAVLNNGRSLAYASESMALFYALTRDGRFKKEDFTINMVPVDTHLSWPVGTMGNLGERRQAKVEGKSFHKKYSEEFNWEDRSRPAPRQQETGAQTAAALVPTTQSPAPVVIPPAKKEEESAPAGSVVPFQGATTRPAARRLAADERRALNGDIVSPLMFQYVDSCCCCGKRVEFTDAKVTLLTEYESLCGGCTNESDGAALARLKTATKKAK